MHACMLSRFGRVTLCDPTDGAHQAPLSPGLSRPECWSGLPCPSPVHNSNEIKVVEASHTDTCSTLLGSLPRCLLPFIRICGETVPEGLFSVGHVVARAVGSRGGATLPAAPSSRPPVQDAPSAPSGGGGPAGSPAAKAGFSQGLPCKARSIVTVKVSAQPGPTSNLGGYPALDRITRYRVTAEGGDKHLQIFKNKKSGTSLVPQSFITKNFKNS